MNKIYEIEFHDIFECPNCKFQKILFINDCCRNPLKIVVLERTDKVKRLLHQCKSCGGVNKTKALPFEKYGSEIKDEINIHRVEEWKINRHDDFLIAKDAVFENNQKISNFGKLRQHYMTENYRKTRKEALIRDNYRCQNPNCKNEAQEVHHLTYINFPNEELEDLQSLCSECHNKITWQERYERFSTQTKTTN